MLSEEAKIAKRARNRLMMATQRGSGTIALNQLKLENLINAQTAAVHRVEEKCQQGFAALGSQATAVSNQVAGVGSQVTAVTAVANETKAVATRLEDLMAHGRPVTHDFTGKALEETQLIALAAKNHGKEERVRLAKEARDGKAAAKEAQKASKQRKINKTDSPSHPGEQQEETAAPTMLQQLPEGEFPFWKGPLPPALEPVRVVDGVTSWPILA